MVKVLEMFFLKYHDIYDRLQYFVFIMYCEINKETVSISNIMSIRLFYFKGDAIKRYVFK